MPDAVDAPAHPGAALRAEAVRSGADVFLLVPLLGPVLLLLAGNADYMFDPIGWIDTYKNLGMFWHYTEHVPHLAVDYKSSRLPWILPGYLAHSLFDELTASYVLHTTLLGASSLALYLLLRDTLQHRLAGAVTAAAWSCCTWVQGIGGWNYHAVAAGAYYHASLWCLARTAASRDARAMPVFGGAFFAAAVHTHLFLVAFAPIAALLYISGLEADDRWNVRRLLRDAQYCAVGALVLTAALAAVNGLTGGAWLFFLPQVEYVWELRRTGNRWVMDAADWIPSARHLVVPTLSLLASALWLASHGRRSIRLERHRRMALSFVKQGWLAFGVMAYFQFVEHQTVLDWSYAAFPLYLHVFPVIGALLSQTGLHPRPRDPLIAVTCSLLIVGALVFLLPDRIFEHLPAALRAVGLPESPRVLSPLVVGAVGVAVMAWWAGRTRLIAFAGVFAVLNAWLAMSPNAYGLGTPGINRDTMRVLRDFDVFTTPLDPSLLGIKYWYEQEIAQGPRGQFQLGDVFVSYTSTRSRTATLAALDHPNLRAEEFTREHLSSGRCLGLLSSSPRHDSLVTRVRRRFDEIGSPLTVLARRDVTHGALSVSMTVLALPDARAARASLVAGAGPCTVRE